MKMSLLLDLEKSISKSVDDQETNQPKKRHLITSKVKLVVHPIIRRRIKPSECCTSMIVHKLPHVMQCESGKGFHEVEFFRCVEQVERLRDVTSASSTTLLIIKRTVGAGEVLIMSKLPLSRHEQSRSKQPDLNVFCCALSPATELFISLIFEKEHDKVKVQGGIVDELSTITAME